MKKAIAAAGAVIVVLVIVGYLVVAGMPYKQLAPVTYDSNTATTARAKLDSIKSVEYGPAQHHKTESASATFTDTEMTWLANWRAQRSNLPFDNIILHANGDGTVEGQFNDHLGPLTFPAYFMARVSVSDSNQVHIDIVQSKWGRWDLPGPVASGLQQAFSDVMGLSKDHTRNFDSITLMVKQGELDVSVLANPHGT